MDFNKQCPDDNWTINFWWQKFFQDPKFRSDLKNRWFELRASQWATPKLHKVIDSLVQEIGTAQEQHFNRFPILNKAVWPNPVVNKTYNGEIFYFKKWLEDRAIWLDGGFSSFEEVNVVSDEKTFATYPNPVANKVNFEFYSNSENNIFDLKITNSLGEIIHDERIPIHSKFEHKYEIDVSNFSQGVYFYQFYKNKIKIASGKFLKI
jgi:hypothetical protein